MATNDNCQKTKKKGQKLIQGYNIKSPVTTNIYASADSRN